MSFIDELKSEAVWREFEEYKHARGHLNPGELKELDAFIASGRYADVAARFGRTELPYPEKRLVNKLGSDKKRVVYTFPPDETMALKLTAYLLYRYDGVHSDGLYSFRRGYGAHRAIRALASYPCIDAMWCYKLDIHDYFNSISVPLLLPMLKAAVGSDGALYAFLEALLTADRAYFNGELIEENRGVMAGTPVSPFLANLYLDPLDRHFTALGLPYARYSDDVILFARTREEIEARRSEALGIIASLGLTVNGSKEKLIAPGEGWEFLGVAYQNGEIDLSRATQDKLKGKIRRKARALRRWMLKKGAEPERAMRAMIRVFNAKFFDGGDSNDLTWARWFFPLVTVSHGLGEMDAYLQQYIRFIPTGRHTKVNYRVDYSRLKSMGYRSLVHEYYEYKGT